MDEQSIKEHNEAIRTLVRDLYQGKGRGLTYTQISERFNGVNIKWVCYMITKDDYEPTGKAARQFGWIAYEQVPVCPIHGYAHIGKCPDETPHPKRPRTPGGWVNAKDPDKAAKQIASRAQYSIRELIEALQEKI